MTEQPVAAPWWLCRYFAGVVLTQPKHATDCPNADYAAHRRDPQLGGECGWVIPNPRVREFNDAEADWYGDGQEE